MKTPAGQSTIRNICQGTLMLLVPALSGCAYHPRLHWSSVLRPTSQAALVEAGPRKGDVTRALWGGPVDPADVALPEERIGRMFGPRDPSAWTLVFFTDSGLMDRTIGLSEGVESLVDKNPIRPVEEIRRGFWQDFADASYLACNLKAFRLAAERGLVQAVVNGGDSVQIGVRPEFESHVELTGKFLVAGTAHDWEKQWTGTWWQTRLAGTPGEGAQFYQILGNHEVLFLGTFNRNWPIRVPADSVRDGASFARLVSDLPPWRARMHAGDTNSALGEGTARCGYYSASQALPDGKRVLLVMLNTSQGRVRDLDCSTPDEVAFHASMGSDQVEWLTATLEAAQRDTNVGVVFVFGHHPLAEVAIPAEAGPGAPGGVGRLPRRLTACSKVKAYFCGHVHSGCPPVQHPGPYPVTEYVVPALMEYTKSFAVIRVTPVPGTSDYQVALQHHNLTELFPFDRPGDLEPADMALKGQARLEAFVKGLDRATCSPSERVQAGAIACYRDAERDLARHRSRHFPHSFPAASLSKLLRTYAGAQDVWELLKDRANARDLEDPLTAWGQVAFMLLQGQAAEPHTLAALDSAITSGLPSPKALDSRNNHALTVRNQITATNL